MQIPKKYIFGYNLLYGTSYCWALIVRMHVCKHPNIVEITIGVILKNPSIQIPVIMHNQNTAHGRYF